MKTFARVDNLFVLEPQAFVVVEIISPVEDDSGNEIPIGDRYHPDFVKTLVNVTDMVPQPEVGWLYESGEFSPPV